MPVKKSVLPPAMAMPTWIPPMLATLGNAAFDRQGWIFEPKLDGQRIVAYVHDSTVTLWSRSQQNMTATYPEISETLRQQPVTSCILDGEIVAFESGSQVSSFRALQQRMHLRHPHDVKKSAVKVFYYLFDLLFVNGEDLRREPLIERRRRLAETISFNTLLRPNPMTENDGQKLYRQACHLGWEGVIAKDGQSSYHSGRSHDWIKLKCLKEQEFVVGGYTDPQGTRDVFGALLLGYYKSGKLHFAGKVGTGFDTRALDLLRTKLKPLETTQSPFHSVDIPRRGLHWVQPTLVAQIVFGEWTSDGKLRHPRYRGLREDKMPKDVTREQPAAVPKTRTKIATKNVKPTLAASMQLTVDGQALTLSNVTKVFYPSTGFTKGHLLDYYTKISSAILPHLRGRPVTMKRYPNGVEGAYFYEKQAPSYRPKWLNTYRMTDPKTNKTTEYGVINNLAGLLWMANLATIELHCLLARSPQVDSPTVVAFDFDPGVPATFIDCAEIALQLREVLKKLKLVSFLKTSGNKGLHLYVPLNTKTTYDATQTFAHTLALLLEQQNKGKVLSVMRKDLREGKVFVDWSQNSRHKTTVCAYSLRAQDRPTVSTPIGWEELLAVVQKKNPGLVQFTPAQVIDRIKLKGDLFAPVQTVRQTLPSLGSLKR